MKTAFSKVFDLLDSHERRLLWILLAIMIVMSAAEVLGISTILVLLNVLSRPEIATDEGVLGRAYRFFGFESVFAFQVTLALGTLFAVVTSIAFRAAGTYAMVRFSKMRGYTISSRLLEAYLSQPYTWFLQQNSAQITASVLQEAEQLVHRVLIPGLQMIASTILGVSIMVFMFSVDPLIMLVAAVLLAGSYVLIFVRLRRLIEHLGGEILQANRERFRLTQESAWGFKEIKLLHLEDRYTRRFQRPARRKARMEATAELISRTPRFALEAVSFTVLVLTVLLFMLRTDGDLLAAIPTLGVFAFAALRLLPTFQTIYQGMSAIKNATPLLNKLHDDYMSAHAQREAANTAPYEGTPLALDKRLELKNIGFAYPSADRQALEDFSLSIDARTTIGIVGGTGAGKTTVVDVILGLLPHDSGEMLVDGTAIDNTNVRAWQQSIGYVPQSIYLVDDTVATNIAFGVPPEEIDMKRVEHAARTASLHDFVTQELAHGYDTYVGDRGVRLSGGQRQRIGIARALYRTPTLLVMDEATSALDNITERVVMEAIQALRHDVTIILIAHRLSTVRNCDRIFLLAQGRIAASGTYDELVSDNEIFREMAANG